MNARLLKFREKINSNRFDLKRKLITFSIFLLIASTFWLLNALSNEYPAIINYPIEFSDFPEGKVLVGDLPENIQLRVKGQGFTLLQYKLFPIIRALSFKISSLHIRKLNINRGFDYFILTKSLEHQIENRIKNDITILSIQPDTLFFQFADVITKKVAVKPNLKISFEKQFMMSTAIKTIPDSIDITGPKSILDTTYYVYTKSSSLKNLSESIKRNVGLEKIENVKFSKKRVNININVEKYTESQIQVPIEIINIPDSLQLIILPENIFVNYKVVLSKFGSIDKSQFQSIVNFDDISFSLSNKLKVKLKKYPKEIFSIDYFPKNIEYIVKR